jgi:uncharacterized membrane protein
VIATFEDEATASDALNVLREAQQEEQLKVIAYAVVWRDADNKLHVKETGDPGGISGAASGGALGLAVGLLAGPVGLAAIAGAVFGGLAMKWIDSGVKNDKIRAAGERLKPGMAALAILSEEGSEEVIAEKLALHSGTVISTALSEEDVAATAPEEPPANITSPTAEGAAA